MKISRIRAYRVELPLHEGSYKWSGGKSVTVFDSTVVEVETDTGVTGFGEVCPLGPFYLPAYANGVRAVAAQLQPGDRLIADANTGWLMHDALRVVRAVRDIDVYIEQPCLSYEECLTVRRHTDHPFVLDEVIDSLDVLLRGHADRAMDVVNIKISKFGGLTKAKQARDLCVSIGVAMTLEDSWGGDIVTAAIAHLAHSTPPELLFTATDFNSYVTKSIAEGAPKRANGRLAASRSPGLGIAPRIEILGQPLVDVS